MKKVDYLGTKIYSVAILMIVKYIRGSYCERAAVRASSILNDSYLKLHMHKILVF